MSWKSHFFPEEIARFKSKYNREILVKEISGKKIIVVGDAQQTGGTITGMWEKSIQKVQSSLRKISGQAKVKVQSCLVLGLGGGDVIRTLNTYYPEVNITCIEIDPVMKKIYEKHFQSPLKSSKNPLKIIIADALNWVQKNQKYKCDLIVVDLYIGKYNPKQAGTLSFLKKLKNLLTKKGIVIYNRHYDENDEKSYQNFLSVCRKEFTNITELVKYKYCRILLLDAKRLP